MQNNLNYRLLHFFNITEWGPTAPLVNTTCNYPILVQCFQSKRSADKYPTFWHMSWIWCWCCNTQVETSPVAFDMQLLDTLTHNMWLHICVWAVFYLNKVVQDGFAGHVTVDSVVSIQEVRSEMMQQRVQVYRVITALLTAVNTLTALKRKPHTNRDHVMKFMLSFLSAGAEFPHVWDVCERCFSQNFCHSFGSTELNNMIRISQVNCDFLPGGKTSIDQFWAKIHSSVDVKLIWGSSSLS